KVNVPFADRALSEEFAASRLVYDYLGRRLEAEGRAVPEFAKLAPLIAMADDNDRWLHRVPGSREPAWVVRSLGAEAYSERLGGGGHAAAAGCELPELRRGLAEALAARIAGALA